MSNQFTDMRDILLCFRDAQEEFRDGSISSPTAAFSAKVQTLMGMSMSRKIQAVCYLFDNVLQTNAELMTRLNRVQAAYLQEAAGADSTSYEQVSKEDAFTALQMAITAKAVDYQNGDNR